MPSTRIIGIAGGTGSGKSTLAQALAERLGPACAIMQHDAYYHDLSHLPFDERTKTNFDHPDALDSAQLAIDLQNLKAGRTIEMPCYDFAKHSREATTSRVAPRPFLIVEGILLFAEASLLPLIDLKVYLQAPEAIRLERRIRRDCQARGRSEASVRHQFLTQAQPMHQRYVDPSKAAADLVIDGSAAQEESLDELYAEIMALGG